MRRIAGLTGDPSKAIHIARENAIPLICAAAGSTNEALSAPGLAVLANLLEARYTPACATILQHLSLSHIHSKAASVQKEQAAPATVLLARIAASAEARMPGGVDDAVAYGMRPLY